MITINHVADANQMLVLCRKRLPRIKPLLVQYVTISLSIYHLSEHETLTQCCFKVGPASTTLAQHQSKIGPTFRVHCQHIELQLVFYLSFNWKRSGLINMFLLRRRKEKNGLTASNVCVINTKWYHSLYK